jgi:hypothetical protein
MITRINFSKIDIEIKCAIKKTLNNLKTDSPESYILFLADGEYKSEYESAKPKLNPFVIDNRIDSKIDETRLAFLSKFLSNFYSFPSSQKTTDDNEFRIHMELMIYSHIWESKPFLKKLYRFAHISNGVVYDWKVSVPGKRKHDFIRNDIRGVFEKKSNPLSEIIKKGFHTSLRNAFAHSDYSFETMNGNNEIILHNYGSASWELSHITFDEWSKRFVYSALLSFHFLDLIHKARLAIVEDFKTDTFIINHPNSKGIINRQKIKYRLEGNSFSFEQ